MTVAVVAIFALTYLLIAARRLRLLPIGRPAGALLGAVLMVAVGALTPRQAYAAIDHDTVVLLLGLMLLTVYLERSGFFARAARLVVERSRTPVGLLLGTSLASGLLSALLMNDAVCLFLTPVVVRACQRARLPMGPYLIGVATSANLGSAATLVGNPQNMIVGTLSGIPFARFLALAGPAAALGLLLNLALLRLVYGRRLAALELARDDAGGDGEALDAGRLARVLVVLAAVVVGFFADLHLATTALAGALALMILERRDPAEVFARVDWPLLVFFSGLFVVVAALDRTGLVARGWAAVAPAMDPGRPAGLAAFTAVMAGGSNVVSNVPMVLLAGPYLAGHAEPELAWVLLAFVTTTAGNLTLVGSAANIIVAERARDHHELGFLEYLRFGALSTVLVLAVCVPFLRWWTALAG